MRIDVPIPIQFSAAAQVELIRHAEQLGFDGAGLADHMEHGSDVFTILGAAATQTNRIELFPCVTNPVTRHPWVLANAATSMNSLTNGRFQLLIGAGDSAPRHIQKPAANLNEMLVAIRTIRDRLDGGLSPSEDDGSKNRPLARPAVIVAVTGPRMTELAGQVADGVLLARGFDTRLIAMARRHVEAGAQRSGRSLEGFKVLHYTIVHIENDKEAAAEFGRARARAWIQTATFKESMEVLGVPAAVRSGEKNIANQDLDRLCESLYLIGPIAKIRDRIREIEGTGSIERLVCAFTGRGSWTDMTTSLAKAIF